MHQNFPAYITVEFLMFSFRLKEWLLFTHLYACHSSNLERIRGAGDVGKVIKSRQPKSFPLTFFLSLAPVYLLFSLLSFALLFSSCLFTCYTFFFQCCVSSLFTFIFSYVFLFIFIFFHLSYHFSYPLLLFSLFLSFSLPYLFQILIFPPLPVSPFRAGVLPTLGL